MIVKPIAMKQLIILMACALATTWAHAQEKKVLVAYFSCTGHTEAVAKAIAQATQATLYRIQAQPAYTAADLDWHNQQSRSSREMDNPASRPALADKHARAETYDVIFLGYPIWWNQCPRLINTFVESYDLKGKTVVPFATSGSSSIQNSTQELTKNYVGINWQTGRLCNDGMTAAVKWAEKVVKMQK